MASIEDLVKERIKEREIYQESIDYDTRCLNDVIQFEEKPQISQTYNPDDIECFKENVPEYFLEFYNKETIKIEYDGMFEIDPPILRFRNDYDNTTIPYEWVKDKVIKLIIKIGEKRFDYEYNKHDFLYLKEKTDDRFLEMNIHFKECINSKTESTFYKISHEKKGKSYKMIFAYYRDKVVFRYGSLPMVKDDAYYEMKL